jgi:hypothetical protein
MEYDNGIWLNLGTEDYKTNQEFIYRLHNLDIPSKNAWFDKLDCNESFSRIKQPEMDLDDFLSKTEDKFEQIKLVIGRSEVIDLDVGWQKAISFVWFRSIKNSNAEYIYFFQVEYNEAVEPIKEIFQEIYKQGLFLFPRIN